MSRHAKPRTNPRPREENFREPLGEQFRGGLSLHEFAGLVEVIVNDGLGVDTEGMID